MTECNQLNHTEYFFTISGSRFRTYYDFGFVALDIIHATSLDSGEYTVRATNHLGSAHTSACVRVRVVMYQFDDHCAFVVIDVSKSNNTVVIYY